MKNSSKITIGILLLLITLMGALSGCTQQSALPSNVKLAIPHMASFKCQVIQEKLGLSVSVPKDGTLISSESVGFYTNGIKNIKLNFQYSNWYDWENRVGYAFCDKNGNNCASFTYVNIGSPGTYSFPVESVNFKTQSLKIIYQRLPIYLIGGWKNSEGLTVKFDSDAYGIALYSTTKDPAGSIVCSTSCNLDCPDIGYRQKLLFTDKTQLDFLATAPYLEYWETIDYDLNAQGGATIYNANTNKFCFAGTVYSASSIKMNDGTTYIYPNTATSQHKACCPGAVISSTYSDMICQSDYTWKVIADTDKITCMSDYNCPGQGNSICQNKVLSGYHCQDKDANGIGICKKTTSKTVECCLQSDCNKDMVCNSATHECHGGSTLPVCGNKLIESGEECDDGNTASGDGCSSICEVEGDNPKPPQDTCEGNCKKVLGLFTNPFCLMDCAVQSFAAVLSVFLAIGAFIASMIFLNPILIKQKIKKGKGWYLAGAGLLSAVFVFVMVNILYWMVYVAIVGFIVFLIVKLLLLKLR